MLVRDIPPPPSQLPAQHFFRFFFFLSVRRYPFKLLDGARHCEDKVSCTRTEYNMCRRNFSANSAVVNGCFVSVSIWFFAWSDRFTIICAIYWRDTTLRWSAGSWISYIPIAQLVNDRVGRWSVYVFVSIRPLNSGHYVCGHRCVPNANLYRFLFGIPFSQQGEFWWFHSFYVFFLQKTAKKYTKL